MSSPLERRSSADAESKEAQERPDVIIDFMRHGQNTYGEALIDKLKEIGQDPDTFQQRPRIDSTITDPTEQLEGRITEEGEIGLRGAARKLSTRIDRQHEIVAVLTGTRTRHRESARIVEEELAAQGIDVVRTKGHGDLVDVKGGGWYTFVEYVLKHQGKSDVNLEKFWWEMYQNEDTRKDMHAKGYEHLGDISERTERVAELLRRFVRRFNLGKTLRVIAITSDINLEQIQQKGTPLAERDQIWVKNADVVEVEMWNAENGSLAREEISFPFREGEKE